MLIAADHIQTFADQVSRARIVPTVLAGEVCDKHGVSTYRYFDAKFLALAQEFHFLQTNSN